MKLKKYIDKVEREAATDNLKKEISNDFGPLFKGPKQKLFDYVKAHPKKSFAMMIGLLLVNFALVLYYDSRGDNPNASFKNLKDYFTDSPTASWNGPFKLTLKNYEQIQEIKDSLAYYANFQGPLSVSDSVTLTRLLEKYAAIDPTIFKSQTK